MIKCETCKQVITTELSDVEYSQEINRFFCCPDCAKHHYFEKMRSLPLECVQDELIEGKSIVLEKGIFYHQ